MLPAGRREVAGAPLPAAGLLAAATAAAHANRVPFPVEGRIAAETTARSRAPTACPTGSSSLMHDARCTR
jgi:hypothetical protein